MRIDSDILDRLIEQAKVSPRLRMNYDLRNSGADTSQRMLNALEPGTEIPVHRHCKSSECVVVLRGSVRQNYYNDAGEVVESYIVRAGDGANVEAGSDVTGAVAGGAVDSGAVESSAVEGGTVDGGAVDGGAVAGGAVDGGAVDGSAVYGSAVDGGAVAGSAVYGSAVEEASDSTNGSKAVGSTHSGTDRGGSAMFVVPMGAWHNSEALESGTVIFECKDGAYEPQSAEDIMPAEVVLAARMK